MIEDLHGLDYTRPAAHMRDYLSVLVPLLREGSVRYRGEFYQVDGGFVVPGTSPVPVPVGALSPLMVRAAGELADGVVTWLAGPRSLGNQITPAWPSRPRTRYSPATPASPTTAGCLTGRACPRRGPWPSRAPRPASRNRSGGYPILA